MLKEELDINCTEPVFLTDKKNRHMKVAKHRKFCLSLNFGLHGLYHHQIFQNI